MSTKTYGSHTQRELGILRSENPASNCSNYDILKLGESCSEKLHLQSYLEMIWSKTGYFGLLGNNIILFIILLDLIER